MICPSIFSGAIFRAAIFRAAILILLVSCAGVTKILAQDAKPELLSLDDKSSTLSSRSLFPMKSVVDQTATVSVSGNEHTPPPLGTKQTQPIVPLTAKEKLSYGARKAFLDPGAYLGPAVDAYFIERRDVKAPGKTAGDKFADGLSYYARSFATSSTAALLGSGVYPALFKQDPRYYHSNKKGFMPRAVYAASRTVLTLGDNGKTQINVSGLGGTLTSAALANIYERDVVKARDAHGRVLSYRRRVGVEPTLVHFGISTALSAATNIAFREFDVLGKLLKVFRKP